MFTYDASGTRWFEFDGIRWPNVNCILLQEGAINQKEIASVIIVCDDGAKYYIKCEDRPEVLLHYAALTQTTFCKVCHTKPFGQGVSRHSGMCAMCKDMV